MDEFTKAVREAMKEQYMKGVNDALDSLVLACDSSVKKAQEEGIPDTITFTNLKKMVQEIKEQVNDH